MDAPTRLALDAAGGDRSAFEAFVSRTQADVWRLCAHLVDPAAADDLTQDTYLRAARALPGFRADASALTWLLAIARRACADHLRRRIRRRNLHARLTAEARTGTDLHPPIDDTVALPALLDALDPDRRAAFVLTQVLGLPYEEAAAVCGCPIGTIRSRVARARADLVAALGGTTEVAGNQT